MLGARSGDWRDDVRDRYTGHHHERRMTVKGRFGKPRTALLEAAGKVPRCS